MENQHNQNFQPSDGLAETSTELSMKTIWLIVAINALVSTVISLLVVLIVGPWVFSGALSGISTIDEAQSPNILEATLMPQSPSAELFITPTIPPEPETYVVQPGDSLSLIAENFDVSLDNLMAINTIDDPNSIQAGQNLIIPVARLQNASPTAPPPIEPTHTPIPFDPPSQDANFTPPPQDVSLTATPTPSPIPSATAPPIGTILVEINSVLDYGNPDKEVIEIQNNGPYINLYGWKLEGSSVGTYTFPDKNLFNGGRVWVYTNSDTDTDVFFHWNLDQSAWKSGDTVTLVNPTGDIIDTYTIP